MKDLENQIIEHLNYDISLEEFEDLKKNLKSHSNEEKSLLNSFLSVEQHLYYSYANVNKSLAFRKIENKLNRTRVLKNLYRYASLVLFFISIGYFTKRIIDVKDNGLTNEIIIGFENGKSKLVNNNKNAKIYDDDGKAIAELSEGVLVFFDLPFSKPHDLYKIRTNNGNTFKIMLSDGSLIHLNSGSNISFPYTFQNKSHREIEFDGEAYFNIQSNENIPFIINTDSIEVTVTGTKFNFNSYENKILILEEGIVSVDKFQDNIVDSNSIIIKPGNKLNIDEDNIFELESAKIEEAIFWTQGILIFNDERFGTIIKSLERHFNLKIINSINELNEERYTGKFDNKSIYEILDTFKTLSNFEYTINSKSSIYIK